MTEESLFQEALAKASDAERAAFLDQACAGQPELRAAIEALLAAHRSAAGFLSKPPAEVGETVDSNPGPPAIDVTGDIVPGASPGALTGTTAAQDAGTLPASTLIAGRYTLQEKIGEGGMGEVWVARQTEPVKRKVALKLIKPGMDSRAVLQRFDQERQALAMMDHPHIARVLDGGLTTSGQPFFVMELVNGLPLSRFCDEAKLTPKERLELFIPICQAVQHAHQKGIVHRDLKPANILVALIDGKPVPKVIDFGVAKATGGKLTDESLSTQFGSIVGTLEYMSPEQAGLSGQDIDTRADIYSLGVILYELLTGLRPIDAKRLQKAAITEMIRMIREDEPSKPSTRLSTDESLPSLAALRQTEPRRLMALLKGELDWVVMKCLEKRRERRYETASGLARDIERYLADEPVEARPPSASYRLGKFVTRHKGPVLAASIILICLLVGIIGTSAALAWALRERDAKGKALFAETAAKEAEIKQRKAKEEALAAETKARSAERQARDKAMSALRVLTDDIVENQMARSAQLTDDNKEFLRRIIKQFEGFADVTSDDSGSRAIRAEGYQRVGLMRYRLGELKEAEAAYAQAIAIQKQLAAQFPDRPEYPDGLSKTQNNLGFLLNGIGRLKEAQSMYTEALETRKTLAERFPDRPEFREYLAQLETNLGDLLRKTGRHQEAHDAFSRALALRKQLVADYPTEPMFRYALGATYNVLGVSYRDSGRLKEAEQASASAVAVAKRLAADFPGRGDYRQRIAQFLLNESMLLVGLGRPKEALDAQLEALANCKQNAADFPTLADYRMDLGKNHFELARMYTTLGRLTDADSALRDALAIQKPLATDFPARTEFRFDLARTYGALGMLHAYRNGLNESEAAYGEAIAIQRRLGRRLPDHV